MSEPSSPITFDLPSSPAAPGGFYIHRPVSPAALPVVKLHAPSSRPQDANGQRAVCSIANPSSYFRWKLPVDLGLTIGLMLVGLPILVVVSAIILIGQGRPVFYRQRRVGKDGRTFRIWKFRSMRCDAEDVTGATWSGIDDPRVTPLGRWLRCSHLDELPQLFNILSGDMSLVGPRPERPEFVSELCQTVPGYEERSRVRPGITGLAQLGLGYDQSVNDVCRKVGLDVRYINVATLRLDLKLLLATIPHIARQMLHKRTVEQRRESQAGSVETLVTARSIVRERVPAPHLCRVKAGA